MSEEKTQDITTKYDTKPTIETVLERINALGERMDARFNALEKRIDDFDVRLDRVAGDATKTYSEMLMLRADFKELKGALREHLPALR